MNDFPVIIVSHINDCEVSQYFRGECDWRHHKESNLVIKRFTSIEDVANHIVKLDGEFYNEVQNNKHYDEFEKEIADKLVKEHDSDYEYSHLIISQSSFNEEDFCFNQGNGNFTFPKEWEYTLDKELFELISLKKKAVTAKRLEKEKQQKEQEEQKTRIEQEQEQKNRLYMEEEHDKNEYARLKAKFEG